MTSKAKQTFSNCFRLRLCLTAIGLSAVSLVGRADVSLRNGNMAAPHGSGTSSGAVSTQTSTAATAAASQAALVAANAQAATQRSLQALQALQAAQGAARQAAVASVTNNLGMDPNNVGRPLPNVPDGIALGGLMPAGGATLQSGSSTAYVVPATWSGVGGLSQTQSGSSVTDTVTQNSHQALLYWNTFNIGRNTTLSFDQSAGGANVSQWVAINEIEDPSLSPSQILGSIQAQGQVYVINQNGIIFGGSSQVNVHGLVASSLALNPDYITNGLLNDAQNNYEFQFSDLVAKTTQVTGTRGHLVTTTTVAPLFIAPSAVSGGTQTVFAVPTGNITVQAGAQLTSPTDENSDGGRIALIAPNVVNNGTISTPDGQTILAAGEQVGLAAHASTDPSLRGLDVYIGQVAAGAATLTNLTFTFNGLPGNGALADSNNLPGSETLTFSGTGQVGSYTPPGSQAVPITGGVSTTIPLGSQVTLASGSISFAASQGGTVTNAANVLDANGNIVTPGGDIEAPRADVTLAGENVNQLGIINGSTSVTLNGRVDLLADYDAQAATLNGVTALYPLETGSVDFGSQSVTQILPELSDSGTEIGTRLALSSLVNVQARTITMEPGSLLDVPSAAVPSDSTTPAVDLIGETLGAGVNFDAGTWYPLGTQAGTITTTFAYSLGTIQLDAQSIIDVSGSEDVADSVSQNIVSAQLRGPELADSTLQQNGVLRGDTVLVNLQEMGVYDGMPWIGTPLGDVSGYVDDIEHTVGQLTVNGGTIALNAGTSVTIEPGSTINTSGGYINYAGAFVQTSKVITESGQLIDISQAVPNVVYEGIYNGYTTSSPKYGISQNFTNPLLTGAHFETGYLQGGNGGSISITSPSMVLDGTFAGNTVAGPNQQTPAAQLDTTYAGAAFLPVTDQVAGIPVPSGLDLSFFQLTANNVTDVYSATSPDIYFESDAFLSQNTPAAGSIYLSQDLINVDGFGNIGIDTSASGNIIVGAGAALTLPYGGDFDFIAANIIINGEVVAPGQGVLDFQARDVPADVRPLVSTPVTDPSRGTFLLGAGGVLAADGLIVSNQGGGGALPMALNGGTITIAALDVDLSPGSAIDVSGGVATLQNKTATYGSAGSISILGGEDPQYTSLVTGGQLVLGSTMTGYSGIVGGAGHLTIQSPLVQIGGSQLQNGDNSTTPFVGAESGFLSNGTTLWIDPAGQADFFSAGGFGSFDLEGMGRIETDGNGNAVFNSAGDPVVLPAMLVVSGTTIDPLVGLTRATATSGITTLAPLSTSDLEALLPSQRSAASLTLEAEGVTSNFSNDGPPEEGGGVYQNVAGGGGLLIRGDLVMEADTVIETEPQVNSANGVGLLAPHGTVAVLGSVIVPGGTITITGGNTGSLSSNQLLFYESSPDQPFPTVDLGPGSVLSTAGLSEQNFNALGYDTGTVLNGGNVVVNGNIVGEAGAAIDVSGTSGSFQEPATALNIGTRTLLSPLYEFADVDSNGGSISLNASQLLLSDATLLGTAGGPSAQGGSLSISGSFTQTLNPNNAPPTPAEVTLAVTQQGANGGYVLPSNYGTGLAVVRDEVAADPIAVEGGDVDSLFVANSNLFASSVVNTATADNGGRAGGFTSLSLAGTVDFVGPVDLTVSRSLVVALSSGNVNTGETGGVIYANSAVTLTAPYVALNLNQNAYLPDVVTEASYPAPTAGTGSLTVNAGELADVGNLSLGNISTLEFNTDGTAGAIRGDGTLQVAGTVGMNATQVYPSTESTFTIDATTIDVTANTGQALPALPLSGGGVLTLNATTINQAGVLRAPLGTINLGTGATQTITLAPGSITSVSAVDPTTGLGILIPSGIVDASGEWFDPQGNDITVAGNGAGGLPAKAINITGQNVDVQSGSTLDITGGGNLFAYGFEPGTGGNLDILASNGAGFSSSGFAILPGYSAAYAPAETFAQSNNLETNGVADAGYYNSRLAVGEQIYLDGSNGLPAGNYTLLPARYALLPGAFLVTPSTAQPLATSIAEPDGSSIVSGYVSSGLNSTAPGLYSAFQVEPQSLVLERAPYTVSLADSFFATSAATQEIAVPRLPEDAGQVVLNASDSMTIAGSLLSQPADGGLGGEVDIASSGDIYVAGPGEAASAPAGALVLDSAQLTSFGADSLLIGGYRTHSDTGTAVTVTTSDLVIDNAGATTEIDGETVDGLGAPDLTLVSKGDLILDPGAEIEQVGPETSGAETLNLGGTSGNEPLGSGDGALVRVSSDPLAQIVRENVNSSDLSADLSIGASAAIENAKGGPVGALILDSTAALSVNTTASLAPTLSGNTLTIDSGSINIELTNPATPPTSGLVITEPELESLLGSTQSLSFLSYSSIALYGSGEIGASGLNASGNPVYQESSLALHADDIYYGDTRDSSGITINAGAVTIDNLAGGSTLPSFSGLGTGSLTINAETVSLGSGSVRLAGFGSVAINAGSAILADGLGAQTAGSDAAPTPASFATSGNLTLTAPLITSGPADRASSTTTTTTVDEAITADGALVIQAPAGAPASAVMPSGVGATISLTGASVDQTGGDITAPSGTINLTAASGDFTVNGTLAANGVQQVFYGLDKYTNGGDVTLTAPMGNITLGAQGAINVSAASGLGTVDSQAGSAGTLTISAPNGTFTVNSAAGGLNGAAGQVVSANGVVLAQGAGGSFSLDAAQLTGTDLSTLETALTTTSRVGDDIYVSGFNGTQSVRLRDQSITVEGLVAVQNFNLSVDDGSITVGPLGSIMATAPQVGGIDATTTTQNGVTVLAVPGVTGGTISLAASGSVVLQGGSLLSAAGQTVDDAGEGGSITLAAGSATESGGSIAIDPTGYLSIGSGAVIDLRVLQTGTTLDGSAIQGVSGVLNLQVPQILSGNSPTGVQLDPVLGTIVDASTITVEGYRIYQPTGGVIDSVETAVDADGLAFSSAMGTTTAGLSPLLASAVLTGSPPAVNIEPGAEIINPSGNLILNSSWALSGDRFGVNNLGQALPGVLSLRAAGNINISFGASLSDGFTNATYEGVLLDPGSLSWSYNIVSGADFGAADVLEVQPLVALSGSGSVLLGYQDTPSPVVLSDTNAAQNNPSEFFQTIRTGTGDINVAAGGNVELLNNLATVYTAGTQVDPTLGGTFVAPSGTDANGNALPATYSQGGGNVTVQAQGDIAHYAYNPDNGSLVPDSSDEMPTNWLDREGSVSSGQVVQPTTWWVDFTNYFEGIGALGGGNVSLAAGGSVINVDADVPTNARLVNGQLTELGGGDLSVSAGVNIDGGVYYVERGNGTLAAGGNVQTNATRAAVQLGQPSTAIDWLPTTLFLGKGTFSTTAGGNLLLGPVANPFLLPQSYNNVESELDTTAEISYFSTYAAADAVNADSLTGTVTIQDYADTGEGSLGAFYDNLLDAPAANEISLAQPWLRLAEAATAPINVVNDLRPANTLPEGAPGNIFGGVGALLPPTLRVTAYEGDIDLVGSLTLAPSATGTLDLAAEDSINAFGINVVTTFGTTAESESAEGVINVSDANPASLPSAAAPLASGKLLANLDALFTETGATEGLTQQTEQDLHADIGGKPLHAGDDSPVYIYAVDGSISGLTAFTPKETQVIAGTKLTDIGLYLQNDNSGDISVVEAGRDIVAYDETSPLRISAGDSLVGYDSLNFPDGSGPGAANSGDIQFSGPGTGEVLAGRDLDLGNDAGQNPNNDAPGDGLFTGLTTVGGQDNPALPFAGANLVAVAGVGADSRGTGLSASSLNFSAFIAQFLDPSSSYASTYLPDLATALGLSGESNGQVWAAFENLPATQQDTAALQVYYLVLRDAGRNHNDPTSAGFGTYAAGDDAIAALFPSNEIYGGSIDVTSREIKTTNGGDIDKLIPGGALTVGVQTTGAPALDQGVLTVDGGNISIFANGSVNVGSSRIFTLHGGNEVIWSSTGNIDAGASSKTVVSAPPTRVVVDPTSGDVETDLAGLATGGGIGVLASVVGAPPGDVDLIAPEGIVDAGDAGIRATGNLNIAAVQVLNASNISVGGKSTGVSTTASVNIGAIAAASSVAGSTQQASATTAPAQPNTGATTQDLPSLITVEVVGYGGGDTD